MTHKVNAATTWWTFAITSLALFMVTLDNLVVTSALPVIRRNLHASLTQLEWTVNAYTLTFAVLLLTGAALGDRYGRRLMFSIGIGVFTWVTMIFVAGGVDRITVLFDVSYTSVIWVFRFAIWIVPIVFGVIAHRVCVELQRGEEVERMRKRAEHRAKAMAESEC